MIIKREVLPKRHPKISLTLGDHQSAILMPVGDIHYGANDFPAEHFKNHIKWGIDRGAWFLGMGDYLDRAPDSQRAILRPVRDSLKQQFDKDIKRDADELIEMLLPSKDSWLGLIRGNHTWTFEDSTCVEQYICKALGKRCDFLGDMALIRIICEQEIVHHPEGDLVVLAHHGVGGGTTIGGQLLKPEQMLRWSQADLVLMGHSHAKIAGGVDRILVTPDGVSDHRTTIVARTGGFFNAYEGHDPIDLDEPAYLSAGSYVERKALMPTGIGGLLFSIGVERIPRSRYYRPCLHYSV